MPKTTKIITGIIIAILVIAGIWYETTRKPTEKGVIKIGFIGPLTGDAAVLGVPLKNAQALAMEEINSQNGIIGQQLEIIFEDGKCRGKDAVSAAQKLINIDKVKIIIGGICSGETLAIVPLTDTNKIILFSPASGSPDVTNAGDYVFRNFPSDASSGGKIAEAVIKKNYLRIAILSETIDYAQAVARVFKTKFISLKGTIVADEIFRSEEIDLKTQIAKILNAKPDALYLIPGTPQRIPVILRQLKVARYKGPIFGNEMFNGEDIRKNYKEDVEGLIFAEPAFNPDDPISKAFLERYEQLYGGDKFNSPLYRAASYDAVFIIKEAIEACKKVDSNCIKNYLYSIKGRKGAAGILTIDSNGDAELEFLLKTIKDGKIMPYE